jgi:putative ABC transport system permease protein
MSRALGKIARRETLRSPGRFIALFLIVFLGAGFLAGLQSASPGMAGTADDYLARKNLADFRLLCELGVTEQDVAAARALPNVSRASGGFRVDLKGTIGDTAAFYAIYSLPEDMEDENHLSQLTLTEGRLPNTSDECVADAFSFIKIGDVITVTEDNRAESLELLEPRRLKVVGLTLSSLYISTLRGNSNIGHGQISNFLYLPREAFISEYYTELNLRFATTEGLSAFSDDYEVAIELARVELEEFTKQRAEVRHREIVDEAETEIGSAEDEYETEKGKVESELASAKEALDDSQMSLDEGLEKYEETRASLANARTELERSRTTLNTSSLELQQLRASWETGKAMLDESKAGLQNLQQQRDALKAALAVSIDPITIATLQMQIAAMEAQIGPLAEQLAASEAELAASEAELVAAEASYAEAERRFNATEKEIADGEKALWDFYYEIERSMSAINEGRAEYDKQSEEAESTLDEARTEIDNSRDELDKFEKPQWVIQSRDDLPGYAGFEADKDRIASLAIVLPWFFFLVATIVCLTTMTRMVEEHRTQIGTLKALGYRRGQIAAIYQSYAWIIGLTGGALGVAAGIALFPPVIWEAYSSMYHMQEFKSTIAPVPCLIGMLGGAITISLATAYACRNTLNKDAAELMRPRSPKSGRRVLLERVTWLWSRLSFRIKMTVRNLLRYRIRFFVTVIGVAGCAALLLAALGLRDSITAMVTLQYGGVSHSQATLILDKPSDSSQKTALNDILADYPHAYIHAESITVSFGERVNGDVITYLAVPENPEEFPDFISFRKRVSHDPVVFPPDESTGPAVIMTEQLSNVLGVKVGDKISFALYAGTPVQVRVAGITENYVYNYLYLLPTTYTRLFGTSPQYTSVYLNSDLPSEDLEALLSEVVATENVATALPVAQLQEVVDHVVANMNSVVMLMIISAFILATVVLYNLITITVMERDRELAMMKVLGYRMREVASSISRETTVLTIIGIALGLVLGIWLHDYVMKTIEVSELMFSRTILFRSFVFASLFPLLCNFIVNLSVRPRLHRIDAVKSLKSVD